MSCPDCFRGGVSTSHPTGTETTIHGLPTYVAQPNDGITPKGVIVFITDAFGWKFVNNRVLADHYAKSGRFIVYCPDFMNGNAMDPSVIELMDKVMEPTSWLATIFMKPVWIFSALLVAIPWKRKTAVPSTHPGVVSFIQSLRKSPPPFATQNLKIAAAGFCWGGKHAVLLAQDAESTRVQRHETQTNSISPQPLIDCAFTAHPSYLDVPSDLQAVKIPLSIAIGDEDMAMKAPQIKQMKEILDAKGDNYEVNIMPGAKHGFSVRMHPDNKHELECAQKAEEQAISWFNKWLA